MKPPANGDENSSMVPSHLQNGSQRTQPAHEEASSNDVGQRSDTWDAQRTRIDGLLSTLKKEMQEVKTMDKNLTRQFIHLGGKIQELKVEKQLYDELSSLEENEEDEIIIDNNNERSIIVLEDTRL